MSNCTYGLQRWPARHNAVGVTSSKKGPFLWKVVRVATCRRFSVSTVWPWHWRLQNSINKRVQESSSVLTFSFHHRLLLSMLHSHNKWTGKVSVRSDLREARSSTELFFFGFFFQVENSAFVTFVRLITCYILSVCSNIYLKPIRYAIF